MPGLLRETWWFALVAAAPEPEGAERVNVGLVWGNGRPMGVEYLRGLPRLACLVAGPELMIYQEVLRSANNRLAAGASLETVRRALSPQLQVLDPTALHAEPDERMLDVLKTRYLAAAAARTRGGENRLLVKRSREALSRLLGRTMRFGSTHMKNVRYSRLYNEAPAWLEGIRVPPLAHAVRGQAGDVLLDGVIVEPDKTEDAIRSASTRISRAFWYYSRLRPDIRRLAGREVRTVGVLFGSPQANGEVAEARAWIRHAWEREDAIVLEAEREEDVVRLRHEMEWAAGAAE